MVSSPWVNGALTFSFRFSICNKQRDYTSVFIETLFYCIAVFIKIIIAKPHASYKIWYNINHWNSSNQQFLFLTIERQQSLSFYILFDDLLLYLPIFKIYRHFTDIFFSRWWWSLIMMIRCTFHTIKNINIIKLSSSLSLVK